MDQFCLDVGSGLGSVLLSNQSCCQKSSNACCRSIKKGDKENWSVPVISVLQSHVRRPRIISCIQTRRSSTMSMTRNQSVTSLVEEQNIAQIDVLTQKYCVMGDHLKVYEFPLEPALADMLQQNLKRGTLEIGHYSHVNVYYRGGFS